MAKAEYDYITRRPCTARTPLTEQQSDELREILQELDNGIHNVESLEDLLSLFGEQLSGTDSLNGMVWPLNNYLTWLRADLEGVSDRLYAYRSGKSLKERAESIAKSSREADERLAAAERGEL